MCVTFYIHFHADFWKTFHYFLSISGELKPHPFVGFSTLATFRVLQCSGVQFERDLIHCRDPASLLSGEHNCLADLAYFRIKAHISDLSYSLTAEKWEPSV